MNRKSLLLHFIWKNPGVSRKEIASQFRLHPNLVSDTVRELLEDEWIVERGPKSSSSGRAPIALHLHAEKHAALAISYSQHNLSCALIGPTGTVLTDVVIPIVPSSPDELVEMIVSAANGLIANYHGHVIGIGIADPGMVDSTNGMIVRSSSFPEWNQAKIAMMLESRVKWPVLLEETTHARAMAQYCSLPALTQQQATMLYLDYYEGIGLAFVTPNGVWRGQGFAGELGHVVVETGGTMCRCGGSGCLESLVGPLALENRAKQLLEQGMTSILHSAEAPTVESIFLAALEGDRLAKSILEPAVRHIGLAISFLAAAFHPGYIVIGGESEAVVRCLTQELTIDLHNRILPEIAASIEILCGKDSERLALVGIGMTVLEKAILQGETLTLPMALPVLL